MRVGRSKEEIVAGNRLSGFTLVELLVVVSVISVMAAIVFPIINKAKERTNIAVCLSNMKQIGAGMQMYFTQYDDKFPTAAPWGSPKVWEKRKVSQRTIQELLNNYVKNGMVKQGSNFYEKRGVFVCPSDGGLPEGEGFKKYDYNSHVNYYNGVPVGEPIWKYTGCSYEYYASNQRNLVTNPNTGPTIQWTGLAPFVITTNGESHVIGAPLSAVVRPSKKAVLGDVWYWHMGDKIPGPLVAFRNTLFVDGHAARVRGEDHVKDRYMEVLKQWLPESTVNNCKEIEIDLRTAQ